LDFEGPEKDPDGLTTLDRWEWAVGGWSLPPTGLVARTPSGGVHLYYRHPGGKIISRNRALPGMDVKADGGYVVVPHANTPTRVWVKRDGPGEMSHDLISFLGTRAGGGGGSPGSVAGYDYHVFFRDGCPDGAREQFFNDLLFRARKANLSLEQAYDLARSHWLRCAQPPAAAWYWHWEHVEYKLHRVWRTVGPTELAAEYVAWIDRIAERVGEIDVVTETDGQEIRTRRRGRVTLIVE
jgi:hypothetical protein